MKDINFLKEHGVNVDKSLELFGDMEIYNETMKDYLEGIDEKKSLLAKYKEANDWANYAIYAHSIKSDARYLGFEDIAAICLEHETAGKEGNSAFILSDYDRIVSAADKMTEVVSEYLDGGETNSTPTNATATQTEVAVEDKPIVIIADDSDLVSNFAANMLGDSYNIVTAKDGKEVLDIVNTAKYKIACLLLDLNMPNVGGFQVLDYFKENNLFAKIPVSIITGENGKESIDKVFGYGIVDMLEKPFSKDDIKRVVEKTIRNANI